MTLSTPIVESKPERPARSGLPYSWEEDFAIHQMDPRAFALTARILKRSPTAVVRRRMRLPLVRPDLVTAEERS